MLQPNTKQSVYTIPDLTDVWEAPALLGMSERLLLFSLIASLQPKRVVEIGTNAGGSARIIASAMNYAGVAGKLATIDIAPKVVFDGLEGNVEMRSFIGDSAITVKYAAEWLGGEVDFVFIDGSHEYQDVLSDIRACLPYMRRVDGASHMAFHDCFYLGVSMAIRNALDVFSADDLCDTGIINAQCTVDENNIVWGGLHVLSYGAGYGRNLSNNGI